MINYLQAIILGLLQGVTEIFPISSLGHSVIFSWLFGWTNIVNSQSSSQSFFVAFLVLLHIATALGLFIFYRKTWIRIIKAFFSSLKKRKAETSSEKLVWLLIVATIPAGIVGLAFEKILRSQFAHPLAAIIFLFINGCILIIGDRYMKAHRLRQPKRDYLMDTTTKHTATKMTFKRAVLIGTAQIFALIPGISRSGITMVGGLYTGLDYEDAARFSFLLATPIILAAGILELPKFFGSNTAGFRGELLAGALVAGLSAYFSVKFLDKYFRDKTFKPFATYCIAISIIMLLIGITGIRHF
jgi:undecaprenyl-diphosphatase